MCVCVFGMDLSCGLGCVQPWEDQKELFYDQMPEARRSLRVRVCVCGMDLSCGLWCVQPYKDQNELFYDQMLEARRSLGAATYIGVLRI